MIKRPVRMPYENRFPLISGIFNQRLVTSIDLASIKDNSVILDIGCFEGYLLNLIRTRNSSCKLYGIDQNKADFKQIDNCEFRIADAQNLPFDDSFFNAVFILDVLEHIQEYEKVINEIHRVLKPNGLCIISGPTESWFYKICRLLYRHKWIAPAHLYTIYDLEKGYERNNFKLVERKSLPRFPLPQLFRISAFQKNIFR